MLGFIQLLFFRLVKTLIKMAGTHEPQDTDVLAYTSEIVAAHVANNTVPMADLPKLIQDVHQVLRNRPKFPPNTTSPTAFLCAFRPLDLKDTAGFHCE
jgi:hypothetical protein